MSTSCSCRAARRGASQVPPAGTTSVPPGRQTGSSSPTAGTRPASDESDIMVVSAQGGRARNLTRSPGVADSSPAWSPDGKLIAFFSSRAGNDIWTMRPDATAAPTHAKRNP